MNTLKCWLACLALAVGVSAGWAQSFTAPNGTGSGGTLTGSVWFPGPFTVSGTNWYLNAGISNYALAPAITNLTGPAGSNTVLIAATGTRATNAFKRYYFDTNVAHILSNVVASASSGDVVELGAGDFRIGVQTIRVPVGVTLKGQGMGQTRIIGDVGVATNSIVQIMSTNIIEDLTIIANKPAYFQYPIGNNMIFGHPAATNAVIRRVQIFGETDCLLISQSNRVSVTLEQVDFRSAWDVCNLIDLDTGDGVPGVTATIIDSQLYSDSAQALNPQALLDPKSQPLIVSGAQLDLINCIVTATNHKAITLSMQGFETNLVYVTDTIFRSAGTNGYGKQIDISTDSDVSVSKAIVSSQRIQDSDINGSSGVTYLPAQTGSLRVSTIRSLDDVFASDGLFARTATITNELQAQTVNTTDLNATGSTVLKDAAVDSLTMALATASRVARIDANGNITNVVSGSPSTEYVKADGTTGTPSGAQTPWTQDINGGGYSLTNVLSVSIAGSSASLASLASFQGDAFALTRATNSPAATGTTNDFQISQSAKPADGLRLLSTSAGQNVWTNGPIVLTVTDTNQTSINVDCALPYTHYIVTTSRTNFDVAFSNTYAVRVGREIIVEFPTNLVTTSVQVTNKDAQTVRWNRGFTTNGAPSVVKTNINNLTLLFSFPTTNHPIVDAANY